MNGAHSLVKTLLAAGVDTCFANPGTSEMHFVAALDQIPGMQCVLGLQENVVTGMADGYYRMARKPACTLLHCGPGLANSMGNLHNARRARSGIVNIVGDQATYHRPFDAPLTADTDGMARTVSAWVHTSSQSTQVGHDAAMAVRAANTYPGQIATLILPANVSWEEGGVEAAPLPAPVPPAADGSAIDNAARALRSSRNVLLLLSGDAVMPPAQALVQRIAQATGAAVMADYVTAHLARGRGRMPLERVPYGMDAAIQALARFEHIILVEDTTEHKPAPAPMLEYLRRTGANPGNVVYVGDTVYDEQCATSAGVSFARAAWGSHQDIPNATYNLKTPNDLLALTTK